jgi:DNA-binding NtrC family response regulator
MMMKLFSVIKAVLTRPGVEIHVANAAELGWDLVRKIHPDIVILDLMMPDTNGLELLDRIVEWNSLIDVVLLTGEYSPEYAVRAIQKGACDYLTKPVHIATFRQRIDALVETARERARSTEVEEAFLQASRFVNMVGRSPEMLQMFARIRRIAPHYRSVLITGETGTGKELAAQALHELSPVAAGPFTVCNCAAVVETLFESELFGHVKGAFTGAVQNRIGLFEAAHRGALFLDEVGELPLSMQGKLLRALQSMEVRRVGSAAVRRVDVRLIAATNRDLRRMVAERTFREDLYYRLSMVEVQLPRVADRKEDLGLLERHFLDKFSAEFGKRINSITHRARSLLSQHSWPGNVRELENAIGHACMMATTDAIDVRDLPEYLRNQSPRHVLHRADKPLLTLAEAERRHVEHVLAEMGGNKQLAAEVLDISRTTLYRILSTGEGQRPE